MNRRGKGWVLLSMLAVLAFSAAPARATWYFTHGAAAIIEPSDLADVASFDVYGWGLEVMIKKGKSVWIHMPLTNPALDGTTANEIQLNWWAAGTTIYVSSVHVYDGSFLFWWKSGKWKGYTGNTSYKTTKWSLGQNWNISRGFGISFLVANNAGKDQKVIIASAGAHFKDQ